MTIPVFDPPRRPSPGTIDKPELKIYKTQFGDGYSQATPAGLNHIKRTVSLKWEHLEPFQKEQIVDFFVARKGTEGFLYTLPGETVQKRYTCSEWQSAALVVGLWNMTAMLEESFNNS